MLAKLRSQGRFPILVGPFTDPGAVAEHRFVHEAIAGRGMVDLFRAQHVGPDRCPAIALHALDVVVSGENTGFRRVSGDHARGDIRIRRTVIVP